MYLQNKYSQLYYNIANRAKSRATTRKQAKDIVGYVEKHHIIPKVLGGKIFKSTVEAALAYNVSAESLRGKINRGVSGWKFV